MSAPSTHSNTRIQQRILVVDDEPSILDAVGTALRYEGYEVEVAATGRDAVAAVTRFQPELIVLDWMLPDFDGLEVGRRLRAQGYDTAVLFLTAKDATENKIEALRAGGDDYVTKPFSLAEVVARTRRSSGARSGAAAATCSATPISRSTRTGTRSRGNDARSR